MEQPHDTDAITLAAASAAESEPASPPDWDSIARDVHCPLCEYNLRGLVEPRCPECGYRFAWAELLDPKLALHPYLFEHHPERNVWSFCKTALGGLRPVRFWRSLSPTQPIRPRRLTIYWVVAMLIALPAAMGLFAVDWATLDILARSGRWGWVSQYGALAIAWRQTGPRCLGWWAFACTWPWLTVLALMIFRASMRKAQIKAFHVRRCVLYTADALAWGAGAIFVYSAGSFACWLYIDPNYYIFGLKGECFLVLLAAYVFLCCRLAVAFQVYLRFDRPWLTILATQIIVVLVAINVSLKWSLQNLW